jgi:prepilin-type processing-associated H-X9-DG protein
VDFFATGPGGGNECRLGESGERVQWKANLANPYLRWPIVFDEYVRNREVWQCPSAKTLQAAGFVYGLPDWLGYLQVNLGNWGADSGIGPCEGYINVPAGWGGDVTDSILQQQMANIYSRDGQGPGSTGVFVQNIGSGEENFYDTKVGSFQDVAHVPVCADSGMSANWLSVANIAYPDICCAECAGIAPFAWGWGGAAAGINGCPTGDWCPECYSLHAINSWWSSSGFDDEAMKNTTRHLGGSNIGFADGHAQWFPAARLCAMLDDRSIEGVGTVCGPWGTSVEGYRNTCGDPPNGAYFMFNRAAGWDGS